MASDFEIAEKHFKKRDIQTWLKHVLLKNYIINWGTVYGKAGIGLDIKEVHFVDCFAGRGEFKDGSEGSPQLAVENLFNLQGTFNRYKDNNCAFHISLIELLEEYNILLNKNIKMHSKHSNQIHIRNGKFRDMLPHTLSRTDGYPALYFIDPFGYKGVHMDDIIKIMNKRSHEVLINAMSYSLVRNITIEKNAKELCNFFGIKEPDTNLVQYIDERSKDNVEDNKKILKLEDKIIALYKNQVKKHFKKPIYLLSKRIYSQLNPSVYFHLIYMSTHRKGLIEMKNAMVQFDKDKAKVEEKYIVENKLSGNTSLIGDLLADDNLLKQYDYHLFVEDLLQQFNNNTTTYGDVLDYFLLNTPLPFKSKDGKSIYDYIKRFEKESTGIFFSKKNFSSYSEADLLIIKLENISIQNPLF